MRQVALVLTWLAIFLVGGFGSLWLSWSFFTDAREARSWPTTNGRVITSEIRVTQVYDRKQAVWRDVYIAVVEYQYYVDGKRLTSDQVRTGGFNASSREGWVDRHLRDYPIGKEVVVYYHPVQHADAMLEPGTYGPAVGMLVLGFGFLFVPAIITVMAQSSGLPFA